jgi:hypothetical protein
MRPSTPVDSIAAGHTQPYPQVWCGSPPAAPAHIGRQIDTGRDEPLDIVPGPATVAPEAQQQMYERVALLNLRMQELDAIGDKSDLDVDSVIALCDRVIDVARKDLQGRCTD